MPQTVTVNGHLLGDGELRVPGAWRHVYDQHVQVFPSNLQPMAPGWCAWLWNKAPAPPRDLMKETLDSAHDH
jgi:hypothetical protein